MSNSIDAARASQSHNNARAGARLEFDCLGSDLANHLVPPGRFAAEGMALRRLVWSCLMPLFARLGIKYAGYS